MLEHGLQNTERPAKTLAHKPIGSSRRFRVGERLVFVLDAVTASQQSHREIGVFRDRVHVEARGLADCSHSPRANGPWYDADRAHGVEGAALKILARDVFQRLP